MKRPLSGSEIGGGQGVTSSGVACSTVPGIPSAITRTATTNPASGPAAPISSRAVRLRGSARSRMMAPSVPKANGKGMKYGRVWSIPWRRATT